MNSKRRDNINKSVFILKKISSELSQIHDEEADALDNIPENLKASERFSQMESAVDQIENAIDLIDEAVCDLESSCSA